MQQTAAEPGTVIDYYSQRKLHPRTGDVGAFNGRNSGHDISPRSSYHDDLLHPAHSLYTEEADKLPDEAGIDFEGYTQDGGLALNVGFDQDVELGTDTSASNKDADRQQGQQSRLEGQAAATAPYRTAEQQTPAGISHFPPPREVPRLAVVLMAAGTRGDVQPFIALGLQLKKCGHRVRIASHAVYREFVTSFDLEFYPLGGDPKVLSDYIVKNRGIMPGSARDAYDQYREVEFIVMSTYRACTEADTESNGAPFTAEAIISNPPTYGHIHCAEKLQVPLQMFFTMPWSPTKAFPHPLARLNELKDSRRAGLRNYLSYMAVDEFTYTGLVHVINKFRTKTLELEPIRLGNKGPHLLAAHEVPFAYCWSEALVPKPADWGPHIDVCGYCFLNEGKAMKYQPHKELKEFLAAGKPPVYIGFGSLIVDDPKKLTKIILEAAEETGQRVLLSRGWGNLGEGFDLPDTVLPLDNVPHDWLMPQCCAVIHHGGAGTTAAGLIAGCPTTVVPFFGDQPFWGAACCRMGVGPKPIPIDKLDTPSLVEALQFMVRPEVQEAAKATGKGIEQEDGLVKAVNAFHAHLPLDKMQGNKPTKQDQKAMWQDVARPHFSNFVHEAGRGAVGIVAQPVRGYKENGVKGLLIGVGKGLGGAVYHPLKGLALTAEDLGMHAVNAGLLVKTETQEQYADAKKSVGKSCFGHSETVGDEEAAGERPPSRADLAAQHELHSLAETRTAEAQKASLAEDEDEDDLEGRPIRRFAVKLSSISNHMPDITKRFARMSFSRRSKERTEIDKLPPEEQLNSTSIGIQSHVAPAEGQTLS